MKLNTKQTNEIEKIIFDSTTNNRKYMKDEISKLEIKLMNHISELQEEIQTNKKWILLAVISNLPDILTILFSLI